MRIRAVQHIPLVEYPWSSAAVSALKGSHLIPASELWQVDAVLDCGLWMRRPRHGAGRAMLRSRLLSGSTGGMRAFFPSSVFIPVAPRHWDEPVRLHQQTSSTSQALVTEAVTTVLTYWAVVRVRCVATCEARCLAQSKRSG